MRGLKSGSALLLLLLLASCAKTILVKDGASQQDFESDLAKCEYEANAATTSYGVPSGRYVSTGDAVGQGIGAGIAQGMEVRRLELLCMKARGWSEQRAVDQSADAATERFGGHP